MRTARELAEEFRYQLHARDIDRLTAAIEARDAEHAEARCDYDVCQVKNERDALRAALDVARTALDTVATKRCEKTEGDTARDWCEHTLTLREIARDARAAIAKALSETP